MAYSATINDEVFFSTDSISPALGLASAVLDKKAGAAGLFSFTALPNNKFYDDFHLIEDYIDVYRNEDLLWSGRVTHVTQAFDLSKKIEAQGLLSVLNDSIIRPVLHEGTLYQLLSLLIASHNSQVEAKKRITIGTIDISDAACYRAYENYETTYSRLSDLVDSFGGYLSIRKVDNTLYLDWKEITAHSVQTVDFGENLLDITKASDTENYISVLIPLGAQIEDEETGERYRVTIESVNEGRDYISVPYADNKIVGVQTWDDVNEPLILLHKGEAWLNAQSILKTKIEVTAVDLADCGYNINNFDVGMVIGVTSRPHSLDNQTFECLEQSLDLLAPDKDKLTLGGVVDGFTIRSQKEARMNTRIIERIDANYTTNKRLNDIRTLLNQDIQENYTLIEQNSESITLLSEQVRSVAHVFYEHPVPPYSQGDLWYNGRKRSAIPGYAVPGYAVPSETEEIYICVVDRYEDESFSRSDWERVYDAKFNMIETLNTRVTTAEINIDAANGRIDLNASDIDNLHGDISSVEIAMDALNTELTLKVDKTDYNAAEIALMINDSGSTIKIHADHLQLEGVVTANEGFKIDTDGYVTISVNTSGQKGTLRLGSGSYYAGDGSSQFSGPALVMKSTSSSNTRGNTLSLYTSDNGPCLIEANNRGYDGLEIGSLYKAQSSSPYYTTNAFFGNSTIRFSYEPQAGPWVITNRLMTLGIRNVNGVRSGGSLSTDAITASTLNGRDIYSSGFKSRIVSTPDYGNRLLYCYEMPQPIFGDMGHGITDENGECLIYIDDMFDETICTTIEYSIFLQKEADGNIWVDEKSNRYFVVKGDPDIPFSWELKAAQRDYETTRLETDFSPEIDGDEFVFVDDTYWVDLTKYMPEQEEILPDFDTNRYIEEQERLLEEGAYETA